MEDRNESDTAFKKPKSFPFTRYVQALLFAAAVGLRKGDRLKPQEKKRWLIRGEYLAHESNYEKFQKLIKSLHNPASEADLVSILVEYAETGVRELYDEYSKTGKIDFIRYAETANATS